MQSQGGSMLRSNLIHIDRPDSTKHVDLHVYVIPKQVWKNRQNLAENEAMERAVSVGFVRVPENLTIHDLRRYILDICGDENNFPKEFLYLRSVGRCLTKVKQQQEKDLKVKNYRPPTTFAPEIYLIEDCLDNGSSVSEQKEYSLSREPPIDRPTANSQTWKKPTEGPPLHHPLFNRHHESHNSTSSHSTNLTRISPRFHTSRNLLKIREEQERLYLREQELVRQRQELEDRQNKEEEAAVKIQTAFRNYRDRHQSKQEQHKKDVAEIERLQKEASKLTRRKGEYEHDVVKLSRRLRELRTKRIKLETDRDLILHQMQQLHAQITIQRKQEKKLWKQKYLIEKNPVTLLTVQDRMISKNSIDIHTQLEEVTNRLNNTTKLRQQAEYESRLLRQELQQISSTLNAIERYRLPKQSHHYQQQQLHSKSISLHTTEQY